MNYSSLEGLREKMISIVAMVLIAERKTGESHLANRVGAQQIKVSGCLKSL